jgi:hypothetical protein
MNRRTFLATSAATAAGLVAPGLVRAHHGWHSFDQTQPVFLEGTVKTVRWQNPHVELVLAVPKDLKVPADLARWQVPAQQAPVDGPGILGKSVLPRRAAAEWTIELAPLTRMQAWSIAEIKPGEKVSVVGYALPDEKGMATLRAEFLFRAGKAYGLRSSPA